MFSPMMSSSWSVLPAIMVNSAPVFFTSSTFACGFWINFQGPQETCARFYFFPSIYFKNLHALARLTYHKTDQTSFSYGLIRPYLGRCDSMLRLKLFLKKVGLSQPSFRVIFEREKNKKKKLLLLLDDDGTNNRIKNPDANDNRTFGLVSDDDYPNSRLTGKCTILTIYYNNNNNNHNFSENNVDNNFKGNDHHLLHSRADYNSALTGSKHNFDTATERKAKNDKIKKSENNADNNSNSNNNNNRCADSDDNNDNNKDGNFISASTPPPSDSNADNAPPGRNNKNNVRLPRFISHPNQRLARSAKQRLPSFISHPNGILLRVFKRQRSMIMAASLKKLSARFICHPNGIVLKVLNQKPRPRKQSSSSSAMEMETESEIAISTSSSSSSMVKIETETKTNRNAEQRVKQLKRVKQRVEHYSHTHHRPQQQYKSKRWTIAIILKLTFVAWDSWTYRIGY